MTRLVMTVTYVKKEGKILLGKKLIRHGKGYWNGFGGHVKTNETINDAAIRELWEETKDKNRNGIVPLAIYKCGIILAVHEHKNEKLELHYFMVTEFKGEAHETNEMIPKWFDTNNIPFKQMWQSDKFLIPFFLKEKKRTGYIYYDEEKNIIKKKIKTVRILPVSIKI